MRKEGARDGGSGGDVRWDCFVVCDGNGVRRRGVMVRESQRPTDKQTRVYTLNVK